MNEPDPWDIQDSQAARLGEILLEARRCATPEARERYLDQACAGNPELRAQAVSLLAAEAAAGDFLGQTVLGDLTEPEAEGPGTMVGPYKLLEKIGEGGFGSVYVAEQQIPIQRRVALKIIKLGMDTRQVVARFEAERQALARMDHPNIAQVFDAGATASGRPYFVMELVRGLKITDYCDRHRLNPQARLALFMDICHAVQHAHQKGIIHRDLKPSNILVAQHDTVAVPKVIDFGIAKATQGRLTEKTLYTGWTQMVGTPVYMSPEQAEFSGLDVDTRSDIYSLGVLLYELLTGHTPFERKTLLQAGLDEIRRLIREVEPPRPSTRLSTLPEAELDTVARARGEPAPRLIGLVEGDLDWIIMKCLDKDRSRRYDTANGLAQDITRHLGHEPILARPPTKVYQFQKWARRNQGLFLAGSTVAAALVIALGAAVYAAVRERQHSTLLGQSRQQVIERSRELQRRLARQYLRKGQALGEQAAVAQGLHWMARAIEELPTDEVELRKSIEDNLVAWRQEWIEPERLRFLDDALYCAAPIPEGKGLLIGTGSGTVTRWSNDLREVLWTTRATTGEVWALAVSPDGERLVIGLYQERKAQLRSVSDGALLGELVGHEDSVLAVAFSPDGRRILTASRDRTARLWSGETGVKISGPLRHTAGEVWGCAFSPDNRLALTGSLDGTVKLWSAETGQPMGPPLQHGTNVFGAMFSPDGTILATGGQTPRFMLWDAATGEPLHGPLWHADYVNSACFSPDGQKLLTASSDRMVRLWSVRTGALLTSMPHDGVVTYACFSPDGTTILAADNGTARLWSTETGRPAGLAMPTVAFPGVPSAWFPPETQAPITCLEADVLALWPAQPSRSRTLVLPGKARSAAFDPSGELLAQSCLSGQINLYASTTGALLDHSIQHGDDVWEIVFSPDGERLLTAGKDGAARLWAVTTRQSLGVTLTHPQAIRAVDWSGNGSLIATGSHDRTARLWSTNGEAMGDPLPHLDKVEDVRFSPDGQFLATACADGTARLWSVERGKVIQEFKHDAPVWAVDISPDGRLIATGGTDNIARTWEIQTGKATGAVLGHAKEVTHARFGPDGRWLLTTSHDGTARLWSVATGEQVGPALKHQGQVVQGVFSPHGDRVLTAGQWDATAWTIAPPALATLPDPRLWVETLTHAEMDGSGTLRWLKDEEVLARKARLNLVSGARADRTR